MYEVTIYDPFTTVTTFVTRKAARETACRASYMWDCIADVVNTETGEVIYHYENGERVTE